MRKRPPTEIRAKLPPGIVPYYHTYPNGSPDVVAVINTSLRIEAKVSAFRHNYTNEPNLIGEFSDVDSAIEFIDTYTASIDVGNDAILIEDHEHNKSYQYNTKP